MTNSQKNKASGPTSQPLTDNSAKRTQDNAPTLSPPPIDTNASPLAPVPGSFLDDSQHFPSNSADKGKSVEILPPEPKRAASPDAKATTQGSGDTKIIVVYFRSKPDMKKAIAAPIASLHNLQFHEHDPSAKKVDEQLRTLVVTDIPLFVTDAQLRVLSPVMTNLKTRGLHLHGSIATDLSEITDEVSAKSVNIPISYNSYNLKPYAYVHFSSAATKESAMGITCALKSIGLTWHEPADVSSLCHCYGRPSSNDKLRELYNKHLPPSHPAKRHNHFARPANSQHRSYADAASRRVSSRSQSHPHSSRSRSQHNAHRHPHCPSQSDLDHDVAAMDVPPLIDWQYITEQITIILEKITHLTTEFAQLQNRVKWLEDQHFSPSIPRSSQPHAPLPPETAPIDQE
ncbi:hypothetical protein GLOIN_2v1785090 [Rhizophagus irregularis DAOM 181602=DAOM 197198]|nr:hypothetical protein GLOIN_2v1785090 [Rhizophagus irregularis DAOM 181602=DAOM 197198]